LYQHKHYIYRVSQEPHTQLFALTVHVRFRGNNISHAQNLSLAPDAKDEYC